MNPIDAVAEAIRDAAWAGPTQLRKPETARALATQVVRILREHASEPTGVRLHDERRDTLREESAWLVTDPETGEKRVLRLRVARGVIGDVEDPEGSAAPSQGAATPQVVAATRVTGGEAHGNV